MSRLLRAATATVAGLRMLVAGLVVIFFAYMIAAVLVQIAGRYLFDFAIDWTAETATFAQIWMVLLAGGLAMRDNLHVSVDVLTSHLPAPALRGLVIVVTLPCLWFLYQAIAGSLALIDIGRIQSSPVLRLPMWIPYLSLPVGLGYFGLEFLLAMAARWQDPRGPADDDMTLTLLAFLALIIIGTPIVLALGVSAAAAIVAADIPVGIIAQRMYGGLDSFTVMAIPFFVLTGIIMERGGIARRIIDFAVALVGWITGSLLLVASVAGIGMAAVSGSGAASTAAISSIMLEEMRRRGYDIDFSAGLMAASGTLGPVIPPSIMMVVLATTANLSIGRAFLAGIVPGLLLALAVMIGCYVYARRGGAAYRDTEPFSVARLGRSFLAAIPAFLLPLIIVGGIIGGVFTPTEAAAVAAFIGLIISRFVYREIEFRALPAMLLRAAAVSASIMMIIATASVFSWLIAIQNLPSTIADTLLGITDSPLLFLLLVNLLLILIGMFMEGISAILVMVPVLLPVAIGFGIDPLHFGVIVILNLSIGMITPPYGITLYVASSVANRSVLQVSRKIGMPFLLMIAILLLATVLPEIVTFLPDLLLPTLVSG